MSTIHVTHNRPDSKESWNAVPGCVGEYEISSRGRVKSLSRVIHRKDGSSWKTKERILVPTLAGRGYLCIAIRGTHCRRRWYLHRLVLEAFVGPCPPGMECRHLNGKRNDNRLENLAWGTPKENGLDRIRHGTVSHDHGMPGERNHKAKLTEDNVREIRKVYAAGGMSQREIGLLYSVGQDTISSIVRRGTWSHIE